MRKSITIREVVGNCFYVNPAGEVIVKVDTGLGPVLDSRNMEEFLNDRYYDSDNVDSFLQFFDINDWKK